MDIATILLLVLKSSIMLTVLAIGPTGRAVP